MEDIVGARERFGFLRHRIERAIAVDKDDHILQLCHSRKVLDLGFLNHSEEGYLMSSQLHTKLMSCASRVDGIDINLEEERGNDSGGLDCPLDFSEVIHHKLGKKKYDVIVAGDIIEHLSGFKGFFEHCRQLLDVKGKLLITTPNPFYIDQIVFSWLRGFPMLNPDHICWFDPFTLDKMLMDNGFKIDRFYWLKGDYEWKLPSFLIHGIRTHWYNHVTGCWDETSSWERKMIRLAFYLPWLFMRKILTIARPLNRWAGFMGVCSRK